MNQLTKTSVNNEWKIIFLWKKVKVTQTEVIYSSSIFNLASMYVFLAISKKIFLAEKFKTSLSRHNSNDEEEILKDLSERGRRRQDSYFL